MRKYRRTHHHVGAQLQNQNRTFNWEWNETISNALTLVNTAQHSDTCVLTIHRLWKAEDTTTGHQNTNVHTNVHTHAHAQSTALACGWHVDVNQSSVQQKSSLPRDIHTPTELKNNNKLCSPIRLGTHKVHGHTDTPTNLIGHPRGGETGL